MDCKIFALIIAGLIAALGAVLLRYEVVGVAPGGQGNQGIAYRLDRWTGSIEWMQASRSEPVERR